MSTPCCGKCGAYYQPPVQSDECPHDVQAAYKFDPVHRKAEPDAKDEIKRLRAAIERIDGINDNPGDYSSAIDAVIREVRTW